MALLPLSHLRHYYIKTLCKIDGPLRDCEPSCGSSFQALVSAPANAAKTSPHKSNKMKQDSFYAISTVVVLLAQWEEERNVKVVENKTQSKCYQDT